jgi:hypothetical protein
MRTKHGVSTPSVPKTVLLFAAFMELLLLMVPSAWAVPSYTRRYGVECNSCHSVWGALTAAGNTFKLSGYRAIMGVDLKPDTEDIEIAHGTLAMPTTLPLSFVTGVGIDSRTEKRTYGGAINTGVPQATTSQTGATFALEDASIFMTSPIGKHLAGFVEFPMYEARAWEFTPTGLSSVYAANYVGAPKHLKFATEQPGFEVAKFFWNNIAGDSAPRDSLNLLFGITHLPLAYSPGKVRLPVNQDLIYERRALDLISRTPMDSLMGTENNDGLFRLSEPQGIVELFGMVVPGGQVADAKNSPWVEYHVGLSNGSNAKSANNTRKDVYGRFTLRGKGQSVGFFGYHSADTYGDDMRSAARIDPAITNVNDPKALPLGIMSGVDSANSHSTYGPNFTLSLVPFGIPVWFDNDILYRRESSPTGFDVAFKWKGGFHQVNWQASKQTMAYARYDWIHGDRFDDTNATAGGVRGTTLVEPREKDYVIGVQSLVAPNLKLIGEFRNHKFEDLAGGGTLKDNGFTVRFMIAY